MQQRHGASHGLGSAVHVLLEYVVELGTVVRLVLGT